jgi:hypothetical protein
MNPKRYMRTQLSGNFYLDEFTRSETAARHGIDNSVGPTEPVFGDTPVVQPMRDALGPTHITSGYRSPVLNQLVGGSARSQHMNGEAADLVVTGHLPADVCRWLARSGLPFDQVILEFWQWTHVSIAFGRPPRGQVLTAYRDARGLTRYVGGIHDSPELAQEAA